MRFNNNIIKGVLRVGRAPYHSAAVRVLVLADDDDAHVVHRGGMVYPQGLCLDFYLSDYILLRVVAL